MSLGPWPTRWECPYCQEALPTVATVTPDASASLCHQCGHSLCSLPGSSREAKSPPCQEHDRRGTKDIGHRKLQHTSTQPANLAQDKLVQTGQSFPAAAQAPEDALASSKACQGKEINIMLVTSSQGSKRQIGNPASLY